MAPTQRPRPKGSAATCHPDGAAATGWTPNQPSLPVITLEPVLGQLLEAQQRFPARFGLDWPWRIPGAVVAVLPIWRIDSAPSSRKQVRERIHLLHRTVKPYGGSSIRGSASLNHMASASRWTKTSRSWGRSQRRNNPWPMLALRLLLNQHCAASGS